MMRDSKKIVGLRFEISSFLKNNGVSISLAGEEKFSVSFASKSAKVNETLH